MMAVANVTSSSGFVDNWQSGKSLAQSNLHMLTSEDSCDVSFRVGKAEKVVRAHRYVLISRSCVFHAMLSGPLVDKNEITITDVEADIFSELLRYLYTDTSEPTHVNVTGLLYLAKKYAVGGLEQLCLTYLESSLSVENACVILEQAHVFDENQLNDRAMKVILDNGEKCLRTEGFRHLSRQCLNKVISSDDLNVKPDHVFSPAILWAEEECRRQGREITPSNLRSVLGKTLFSIPFPDMDPKYYVEEVLPRHILTDAENVAIMAHHVSSERNPSPFRKRQQKVKLDVECIPDFPLFQMTDVMTHHVSSEMNPSPLRKRLQEVTFDVDVECSPESPLLQWTDVIFFKHQERVQFHSGKVRGSINFTCSRDVDLIGVYVFAPVTDGITDGNIKYTVEVTESHLPYYSVLCPKHPSYVKPKENHIRIIKTQQPEHIRKGVNYTVEVSPCNPGVPVYHGQGLLNVVNVGHLTFSNIVSNGPLNLIYGLRFRNTQ